MSDIMAYKVKTAEERLNEQKAKEKEQREWNLRIVFNIARKIDEYMDANPSSSNSWHIDENLFATWNENYNAAEHLSILISLYKAAKYEVSYNDVHKSLAISIKPIATVKDPALSGLRC